jgi:hypothetical protein
MTTRTFLLLTLFLPLLVSACSSLGLESDPNYNDPEHEKMYKNGSLLSDNGGLDLFGGDKKKTNDGSGIGVNGFLWRASLDTISFMPIISADPFGGVIITDWYSAPDERTKLNVFIRDRDLRADGVKVSVFRQIRSEGDWRDASVAPATAGSLENAILTRARQIRLAQKQAQ